MAKIPLPERGQPLDVTYINTLSNAINELTDIVSSSTDQNVSLYVNGSNERKRVNQVVFLASYVPVVSSGTKSSGEQFTFPITYSIPFKHPPIITATPVNIAGTVAGKNVTIVLNDITASSAQGIVTFNTTGDLSIGVNLIIVGIPNQ